MINSRRLLAASALLAGTFALGWWVGQGVGPEFISWWNRNSGFATLVAGLLTFLITAIYVVLTFGILRQSERATERAAEANELVRRANQAAMDANAISQRANTLASELLSQDREMLLLALRDRFDQLMPRLTISLIGEDLVSSSRSQLKVISWDEFLSSEFWLRATFRVANHGDLDAVISITAPGAETYEIATEASIAMTGMRALAGGEEVKLRLETRLSGDDLAVEARIKRRRTLEATFRSRSPIETACWDEYEFWMMVEAEARAGDFVPQHSIEVTHSGSPLVSERHYPIARGVQSQEGPVE